jgi:hypothetical protein
LNVGRLLCTQRHRPTIQPHRQLAIEHGEPLREARVEVFPDDACSGHGEQFPTTSVFRILPRELENASELAGHRIGHLVANVNRSGVERTVRIRMRHA